MSLGQSRGELCPWFGHISKSLFHMVEPQHLCPLKKKVDGKGWKLLPAWWQWHRSGLCLGDVHLKKRSNGKEHLSSNCLHHPANLFLTFVPSPHPPSAASSSPCPAETRHHQPLLFLTCLQVQLFLCYLPMTPVRCRASCLLPGGFLGASFCA